MLLFFGEGWTERVGGEVGEVGGEVFGEVGEGEGGGGNREIGRVRIERRRGRERGGEGRVYCRKKGRFWFVLFSSSSSSSYKLVVFFSSSFLFFSLLSFLLLFFSVFANRMVPAKLGGGDGLIAAE